MNTRPHLGWKIAGVAACLYALWVLVSWPRIPAGSDEFRGYIRSLHPVRVYMDGLNIVVVQGRSGPAEFGKYIIPEVSSSIPLEEGGFVLGPEIARLNGALVYEYQKPNVAADRTKPFRPETFRLETNFATSAAGSSR